MAPVAALEFQHFKDTIIDKINSYFGYRAVTDLRISQNYIPKDNRSINNKTNGKKISESDEKIIKSEVQNMKNNDLKKSLINLGINILKESK